MILSVSLYDLGRSFAGHEKPQVPGNSQGELNLGRSVRSENVPKDDVALISA